MNKPLAAELKEIKAIVKLMLHPTSRMAQDGCVEMHRNGLFNSKDLKALEAAIEQLEQ